MCLDKWECWGQCAEPGQPIGILGPASDQWEASKKRVVDGQQHVCRLQAIPWAISRRGRRKGGLWLSGGRPGVNEEGADVTKSHRGGSRAGEDKLCGCTSTSLTSYVKSLVETKEMR